MKQWPWMVVGGIIIAVITAGAMVIFVPAETEPPAARFNVQYDTELATHACPGDVIPFSLDVEVTRPVQIYQTVSFQNVTGDGVQGVTISQEVWGFEEPSEFVRRYDSEFIVPNLRPGVYKRVAAAGATAFYIIYFTVPTGCDG